MCGLTGALGWSSHVAPLRWLKFSSASGLVPVGGTYPFCCPGMISVSKGYGYGWLELLWKSLSVVGGIAGSYLLRHGGRNKLLQHH